ncbi:aldo/keto reductase [Streptomyces sp. OE57]|uniref:aldo/keto reductase n=1 Tax=Streptomyces lacaronensis TaxID=3379885 RepID=UPI0039B74917
MTERIAHASGVFEIAGKKVARLGFGAMRLTGLGVWGEPDDRQECVRVVRRAVELGVQLIDTADSYGPYVSEEIIREAIHPYPDDVLIATKAGLTRNGPDVIQTTQGLVRLGPKAWPPVGRPEYLRQEAEMSLRRLGLDHIDLFQLHRVDPKVPLEDQVGELKDLQDEGKVVEIGLSQVSVDQIERARQVVDIVTVQNRYNLTDRGSADVLDYCTREGIGFITWAPVAAGELARSGGPVDRIAAAHAATPSQVALAWLLARSEVVLPIPGTSKVAHLEDNTAAAKLRLNTHEIDELTNSAWQPPPRDGSPLPPLPQGLH